MTNTSTSGSVLCCSRDYLFLLPTIALLYSSVAVALPAIFLRILRNFDRSDRWYSNGYFHRVFFKPDPVGFEAGPSPFLSNPL